MRNDGKEGLTPDLPPPVEAPELRPARAERTEQGDARGPEEKDRPPDPEHGPGGGTGTGEPPD